MTVSSFDQHSSSTSNTAQTEQAVKPQGMRLQRTLGALETWSWGLPPVDKKKIDDLLDAVAWLGTSGVTGVGIIGAYHMRRLAPLQARCFRMWEMGGDFAWQGTCIVDPRAEPRLSVRELKARLSEAMGSRPRTGTSSTTRSQVTRQCFRRRELFSS